MRAKTLVIVLALAVLAVSVWPARQLFRHRVHAEPERRHAALYCRRTLPGISVTKAGELMQTQDKIIRSFPEVASVYGKAGPRSDRDRSGAVRIVRDRRQPQAEGSMASRRHGRWPDRGNGQGAAVSRRLQRLDHADQGAHRHAVDGNPHPDRGQGDRHDLVEIDKLAKQIEQVLKTVPGTSSATPSAGSAATISK